MNTEGYQTHKYVSSSCNGLKFLLMLQFLWVINIGVDCCNLLQTAKKLCLLKKKFALNTFIVRPKEQKWFLYIGSETKILYFMYTHSLIFLN